MTGIVVGIDSSSHSERALSWAAKEAAMRRVPLRVITVHQPVVDYWDTKVTDPEDDFVSGPVRKAARAQTDKVLSGLGGNTPPEVTVEAISGSPALELLRSAEETDADLLVVGSRGAGGFKRLLMGSVSSQVTHHARCPVMVIPNADA